MVVPNALEESDIRFRVYINKCCGMVLRPTAKPAKGQPFTEDTGSILEN